jgi:hypothetical protein
MTWFIHTVSNGRNKILAKHSGESQIWASCSNIQSCLPYTNVILARIYEENGKKTTFVSVVFHRCIRLF